MHASLAYCIKLLVDIEASTTLEAQMGRWESSHLHYFHPRLRVRVVFVDGHEITYMAIYMISKFSFIGTAQIHCRDNPVTDVDSDVFFQSPTSDHYSQMRLIGTYIYRTARLSYIQATCDTYLLCLLIQSPGLFLYHLVLVCKD